MHNSVSMSSKLFLLTLPIPILQVIHMELTPVAISRYLAHLNIAGAPAVTEDFLVTLTRAHLEVVPFENLEVHYEHREPSLAASDLFHKVVDKLC